MTSHVLPRPPRLSPPKEKQELIKATRGLVAKPAQEPSLPPPRACVDRVGVPTILAGTGHG